MKKIFSSTYLLAAWVFLFLNAISLIYFQSLTSTRLMFLVLLVFLLIIKPSDIKKLLLKEWVFLLFIFSLGFFNLSISVLGDGDTTQFSRFIHFGLFSILAPLLLIKTNIDEVSFHRAVVLATLFQVCFVFLTYTSREVNDLIFTFVVANNSFGESLGRAPGLSSSGGASLSLVIALGALSIARLAQIRRSNWDLTVLVIISLSNIIVGRTGLIVCLIALALFFINTKLSTRPIILTFVTLGVLFLPIFDLLLENEQFLNFTLNWALSGLSDGKTTSALLNMGFPDMNINQLLVGSGQVVLPNGLNASNSDVGFIQTSFALGIVLSTIFYFMLLMFLFSYISNNKDRVFSVVLVFSIFLVEIKEPFVFKYFIVFYVFTTLLLIKQREL